MRQIHLHNVSHRMGALFIILTLGLAACLPLQPPAPQAAVPTAASTSTSNPIPVTGGEATSTPAPTSTPTAAANTPMPTQAVSPTATAVPTMQVKPLALKTANNKKLGTLLVDANGMTLYTHKQDTPGVSTCTGACAATWLPAFVPGAAPTAGKGVKASLLGSFTRPDGMQQATYKGMPLYYFIGDKKAGDVKGQGSDKEWFVVVLARPVHKSSSSSNSSSNNNSNNSGGSGGSSGGSGGNGGGGGGGMGGGMGGY